MCGRFVMLTAEELEDAVAAVQSRLDEMSADERILYGKPGFEVGGQVLNKAAGSGAGEASLDTGAAGLGAGGHLLGNGVTRSEAFPGSTIALIARDNQERKLELAHATWGFQTEWSKRPIFNTRIESALEGSAMWRDAIENGRCLVPAAAFFEPHATETVRSPKSGRPIKRAYRFADPDGLPLLLAGVRAEDRCSVVTCEPNRWVSPIHPRMPLVLRFEEVSTWLDGDWPSLANRDGIELAVQPELPQAKTETGQLSLF